MSTSVKVITGIGGMGRAIARRLGSGSTLMLADYSADALAAAAQDLRGEGYEVITHEVDVSNAASVAALARAAANAGPVTTVVSPGIIATPMGQAELANSTGTDVLVDGGVVAAYRNGRITVGQL